MKDCFTFVDEILTQNSDLYFASLDVDVLFTNIPLDEAIDICVKKIFKTGDTLVKGISKNDFCDLLNLVTKESFFTFNNKFYIQVDGVVMGSPLGPILTNIFFSHHEKKNGLMNVLQNLNHVFIESMLMIFFYFLNHLNLPNRFANICPLNTIT